MTGGRAAGRAGARPAGRLARWVFALVTLCLAGWVVLLVLAATGRGALAPREVASAVALWLGMYTFAVVGVLIAGRLPRNPIVWVLLGIGLVWEVSAVAQSYAYVGLVVAPGALPRPDIVAVLTTSMWVPGIGLIGTYLLLLFPDGRLPSPRWRAFSWTTGVVLVGLTVVMPLLPVPLSEAVTDPAVAARLTGVPNPLGVGALAPVVDWIFPLVALVPVCIAGSVGSLVVRFRRARGRERVQLRWLVGAAVVTAGIYVSTMVLSLLLGGELWEVQITPAWIDFLQIVSPPTFVLIPLAIGVAILRHRLYDIDRLVSRTVTYTLVVAALGAVYVVAIAALTRVLPADSDVAVAASTLLAAAVFRPLQRRVRRAVDRRFNRARFDIEGEIERFARLVRDQTDPLAVAAQLNAVVTRTLQPVIVGIWTRPERAVEAARGVAGVTQSRP